MKDYYYLLNIPKTATKHEIISAFRKLSKKIHPDVNKGDKFFEEHFKKILEAYQILIDENKRKEYDIIYDLWQSNRNQFDDTIFETFWQKHKRDVIKSIFSEYKRVKKEFDKQKEFIKEQIFNEEKIKKREEKAEKINRRIIFTLGWSILLLVTILLFFYSQNNSVKTRNNSSYNSNSYETKNDTTTTKEYAYLKAIFLGRKFYSKNQFNNAIKEFKIAKNLFPERAEVYFELGKVYWRQSYFDIELIDKSFLNLQKALDIQPNYPIVFYTLGSHYYEIAGRRAVAVELFKDIDFGNGKINVDEYNKEYNLYMSKAIFYTKLALKYKNNLADAHLLLGQIYVSEKKKKMAKNEYYILKKLNKKFADSLTEWIVNRRW